jgi:hypothetical protein
LELVLSEGTHTIDLIYQRLEAPAMVPARAVDGSNATIGLQSARGALTVLHRGAVSTTTGVRFTPVP